jgi:hypothetical protein
MCSGMERQHARISMGYVQYSDKLFAELPVTHVAHACIEQSCSLVWVIQFNSSGLLSFTVTFQ